MSFRAVFTASAALALAACVTSRPVPRPAPPAAPVAPAPPPPPTPAQRCESLYGKMEALPDFRRQFTAQLSDLGENALPLFRQKFLQSCAARSPEELSCLEQKLEECEALEPTLREAGEQFALEMTASMSPEQRTAVALKAARSEAQAVLASIAAGARSLHAEALDPVKFQFPPTVGPTPGLDCCAQGGECRPDPAAWSGPTWRSLGIVATELHRYQYEFKSQGKGRGAAFVARAVGDPLCAGKREAWEVSGKVKGDAVELSEPRQVQPRAE